MIEEIKMDEIGKAPSEAINAALAETLQDGLTAEDSDRYCTLIAALYCAALPDATSFQIEELVEGFGAGSEEFPHGVNYGIYDPEQWSPEIDYYLDGVTYPGYQVNKAFFLMMMEEWFLANPEEDSWEAIGKWKMGRENTEMIKEIKND